MYNKFHNMIEDILKGINDYKDIKSIGDFICKCVGKYFKDVSIYFGKKHGKRVEYITGSSSDTLNFPEKIEITEDYYVFIENFNEINREQKYVFISLLKLIIKGTGSL
ncbi:hypothetical protein ACER0A_005160 [Haloimpatiens sp. FM7315]|uniref:hypothetical protein n=1 Tax=Haloimpatiens sp. FM7315 TaxID=3298609 RepID=UPI0035A268A6